MHLAISFVLALGLQGAGELSLDRAATWSLLSEALAATELPVAEARLGALERFDFDDGEIVGELELRLAAGTPTTTLSFRARPELDRRYGRWGLRLEAAGGTTLRVELPDRLSWELGASGELSPRLQRVRVEESRVVLELGFSSPASRARAPSR